MKDLTITTMTELETLKENNPFFLLYISQPLCGVCQDLLPKVKQMLKMIGGIDFVYSNTEEAPEVAGQLSIFTIPGILVFLQGKETIREARYISLDTLEAQLRRLKELAF